MLDFAWLPLRQAQDALNNERLEDARRLLAQPAVQGHKRSWELHRQLADAFIARGERYAEQENDEGAWSDLLQAEALGRASGAARLRKKLAAEGLAETRKLLEAGDAQQALGVMARLRDRNVQTPVLLQLTEAAKAWSLGRELADRGEFGRALTTLEPIGRWLLPMPVSLEKWQRELERHREVVPGLLIRLHEAVTAARWREVIELTDQILAAAPQHEAARKARSRAWKAIEPVTQTLPSQGAAAPAPVPRPPGPPQRYFLWIDGVGGYLVCLANRITIGQACPENEVDVPVFADISRWHATLTRDAEGYLLEGVRAVQVNGESRDKTWLRTGDRLTLGANCQFQFSQPAAISASARLTCQSGHRLPVAVEGVLLMADTLLLGPGAQVHVPMPDLKEPVVLYRHPRGLAVRHKGGLVVDGQAYADRAELTPASSVSGDDFRLAFEPIGGMGRTDQK